MFYIGTHLLKTFLCLSIFSIMHFQTYIRFKHRYPTRNHCLGKNLREQRNAKRIPMSNESDNLFNFHMPHTIKLRSKASNKLVSGSNPD